MGNLPNTSIWETNLRYLSCSRTRLEVQWLRTLVNSDFFVFEIVEISRGFTVANVAFVVLEAYKCFERCLHDGLLQVVSVCDRTIRTSSMNDHFCGQSDTYRTRPIWFGVLQWSCPGAVLEALILRIVQRRASWSACVRWISSKTEWCNETALTSRTVPSFL